MNPCTVVVDAQNSFCKPGGLSFDKREQNTQHGITKALKNIRIFLGSSAARNADCVYLCNNKSFREDRYYFHLDIVDELRDHAEEHRLFWREDPSEDPFNNPSLVSYLKSHGFTSLALCGFYFEQCVSTTALCALKRKIPVTFITDCMYSFPDDQLQELFLENILKEDRPLVSFVSSQRYIEEYIKISA